jgi:hypothetical protein
MPIPINCPACHHAGNVPDQYGGKTIRCPKCQAKFVVPPAGSAVSAAPRPAQFPANPQAPRPQATPVVQGSPPSAGTRCPYCSEPIQASAKKCKHCGEWLDPAMRPGAGQAKPPATPPDSGLIVADPLSMELANFAAEMQLPQHARIERAKDISADDEDDPAASLGIASLVVGLLSALMLGIGILALVSKQANLSEIERLQQEHGRTFLPKGSFLMMAAGCQGYILAPLGIALAICALFQKDRSHVATFIGFVLNLLVLGLLVGTYLWN